VDNLRLATARLDLCAATLESLEAELRGAADLARCLDAEVTGEWPPGEHDADAVRFFHERLVADGERADGWYAWYARLPRQGARAVLVGSAGYFGPPDAERTVEIGYSVCPSWRRQGLAREMVEALCARAFAEGATRVIAHCTPSNQASVGVLLGCGFVATATRRPEHLGFARAAG
jgi:ribosomal-protein-alanine N-acetyltransferase